MGFSINIPKGYYFDIRSKSSNFKNGWASITGLIDSGYTYSWGVQLKPDDQVVSIEPDEKVSQIVMLENKEIFEFEEVPLAVWEDSEIIKEKRNWRTGGFGSTGSK